MADCLLVLNAGSSSLKFGLYAPTRDGDPTLTLRGQFAGIGVSPKFQAADSHGQSLPGDVADGAVRTHGDALTRLFEWLARHGQGTGLVGAGHRVVHGGTRFTAPVRITPQVIEQLAALEPLAPHHQPHNVAAIRALAERLPDLPQIACFDTAFHATQPAEARSLGLPPAYADRGMLRYGFHGLSYDSIVAGLPRLAEAPLPRRLVVAHLGNGASMCAIKDGRSIATTMGFSTLDGLVMGTRSGSVDPGALLHLMRAEGMDPAAIEDLLYNRSGLLGLSGGLSADMKTLLASDDPAAATAVAQYCYQIHRHLGSLAAALRGLDALVFTGGIGENAAAVRAAVCRDADWLGIVLDEPANEAGGPLITTAKSRVPVWVMATDEELTIARHCRAALRQG